ncbi:MAG: Lrp/AsnC family transcriptional regulator [Candidatus Micrarchaeota archaeon]|nr:Lrp/AsnC family transcriptional regulator [Candidatus Micrarchaeota archaeon]
MEYGDAADPIDPHSAYTKRLLRALSMNSRITVGGLARATGVTRRNVQFRLAFLQKRLRISYTLELDQGKMGLTEPHIVAVKFKRKPDYGKIGALLASSPTTQLALATDGRYDLLVYANSRSAAEYYSWDAAMRSRLVPEYGAEWESSEISYQRLGFFSLRNEAIAASQLKQKDKELLMALNENARLPLKRLASKTGMNYKSVAYHLKALVSRGIIRRFTMVLGANSGVVPAVVLGRFVPPEDAAGVANVTQRTFSAEDSELLVNRYQLTAALVGSYGFMVLGAFKNRHRAYAELFKLYKNLYRRFGYTRSYPAVVTRVLVGRLPIRNADNMKIYKAQL